LLRRGKNSFRNNARELALLMSEKANRPEGLWTTIKRNHYLARKEWAKGKKGGASTALRWPL